MASLNLPNGLILVILSSLLQSCEGYCTHYGGCYSVWSMWYFWLSLVVLLVICCGAMGGYWRRRRMMQAMNHQTTAITVHNGPGGQPGATNQAFAAGASPMAPPPYAVATQSPAPNPGFGLGPEDKKNLPPPPAYTEAMPTGIYQPAYPTQPSPYPVQPSPYPAQLAPYPAPVTPAQLPHQQTAPYPTQASPMPQPEHSSVDITGTNTHNDAS